MKSYLSHLRSTSFLNEEVNVFRSSAIFPIFLNRSINCKINFLSYWMVKKKIAEITCIYSIRDNLGKLLIRKKILINYTKNYEISLRDLILDEKFLGSIEIEFFSSKNLVFPFPAVIVNYISKNSTAFVHTCGRIYNNHQDKVENNKMLVPETGFDILPSKNFKPFFAFVNGPEYLKNQKIKLALINCDGEKILKKIFLKNIIEYETRFIFFLNLKEKKFFKNKRGTIRIYHNFKSFYPRFLCGNFTIDETKVSLTHTYYDLSNKKKGHETWKNRNKAIFHNPIVVFPFITKKKSINELSIYPNFTNVSNINLNAELINKDGRIISYKKIIKISSQLKKIVTLNFNEIFKDVKKELNSSYFIKLYLENNKGLPTRFKVGYNLSISKIKPSTNICFNAIIPNEFILKKKSSFKWCAIINTQTSLICLSNINYFIDKSIIANVKMTIWSDNENKNIIKYLKIPNNGNLFLSFKNDNPVKKILKNKTGWVTFESDSPFLNGFYFDFKKKDSVAGDHLF